MKVGIIGGGIGGLTTAIALKKLGFRIKVYESAASIKPLGAGLSLAANALKAYADLGLLEKIIKKGAALENFCLYSESGQLLSYTNSLDVKKKFGIDNITVHRAELHDILISSLDEDVLLLGKKLKSLENGKIIKLQFEDGTFDEADCLIAADGIHSVVRKYCLPDARIRYAGYTCWRAVIKNPLKAADPKSFSETWGSKGRFGLVPIGNQQLYWYACINSAQDDYKTKNMGIEGLYEVFKNHHKPIPQVLEKSLNAQYIQSDIIDLEPLNQYAFDNLVLIGDAAHAMTPNIGQGACQAIEDAVILSNCMQKFPNPNEAFKRFEQVRLRRVQEIVKTSRRVGKVAQINNKFVCKLRNVLLKSVPDSFNQKRLEFLFKVNYRPF